MQAAALVVSLVCMAVVALAFILAARAAGGAGQAASHTERRRMQLIVGLAVIGVAVSLASMWPWPHAAQAGSAGQPTINVTGGQWYWRIDNVSVPRGVPVTFNVRTADVTHGFGVADADGRLLFQVQAMPGYVNRVAWTFDKPGTYRVVCLEYCGVAHHAMLTQFTVEEGA